MSRPTPRLDPPPGLPADPVASYRPDTVRLDAASAARDPLGPTLPVPPPPATRWDVSLASPPLEPGEAPDLPDGGAMIGLVETVPAAPSLEGACAPHPAAEGPPPAGAPAYRLRRHVGAGGFGDVWEAVQVSLGRVVAVKRLRAAAREAAGAPPSDAYRRAERLFRQEAYTTALLDHPNIVPVHDLGVDEQQRALLAMKLVRGTPWDELLRADREALDAADFLDRHVTVLVAVAQAVAFAHARGIVHRDLKPHQVMVGAFGETLLMDWGLALRWQARPADDDAPLPPGEVDATPTLGDAVSPAGTPAYMAPEQTARTAAGIGPWTDVYLLGATLYHLLTGRTPHAGATSAEMFAAAAEGDVVPFEELAEGRRAPAELRALAMAAMRPLPAERLASAEEFVAALRDWQTGASRRREAAALVARANERLEGGRADYATLGAALAEAERALALRPDLAAAAAARDRALALWSQRALAHGDDVLARVQAERVGDAAERAALLADVAAAERRAARQARQRRRLVAATALLAVAFAGVLLVFREFRQRAAAEIERQWRTAALVGRVDRLRRDEAAFAELLDRLAPLPSSADERARPVAPQVLKEVRGERRRLADERRDVTALVGAGALGEPPAALVLADANLLLATAASEADHLAAYRAYEAAAPLLAGRPDAATGLGLAALRAGYPTSATLHLAAALALTEEALGRDHPEFLRALERHAEALLHIGGDADHQAAYRDAVSLLEPRLAETLLQLSSYTGYLGEIDRAVEHARDAAALLARIRPPEDAVRLRAEMRLVSALLATGDIDATLAAAEGLEPRLLGSHEVPVDRRLDYLGALGEVAMAAGRLDEADRLFRVALDLADQNPGADPRSVALVHNNYGLMLRRADRLEEAEREYRLALALMETTDGHDHTETFTVANNLAIVLDELARGDEAMALHERVLRGSEERLGPEHPETARAIEQYAIALRDLDRLEEARPHYERALDIRRRTLGPHHPDVATSLNNVAMLLWDLGRRDDALAHLAEAIAILERDPASHAAALSMLLVNEGNFLRDLDRPEEALATYREAERLLVRQGLADTLNASYLYSGEATLAFRAGRPADAAELMARALDIRERVLGGDHPFVARTRGLLQEFRAAADVAAAAPAPTPAQPPTP